MSALAWLDQTGPNIMVDDDGEYGGNSINDPNPSGNPDEDDPD
jgi:hypothetical protein